MDWYRVCRGAGYYYTTIKPEKRNYGGRYTKEITLQRMRDRRLKIKKGQFIITFN